MYYKVIDYFGPKHPTWQEFAANHWIQPLLSFDSIDGILCPDLFEPSTEEDWAHCVAQDCQTSLITDLEYAIKVRQAHPDARLVGVEEDKDCDGQDGLLGYDILDGYNDVSLLTNWGPKDQNHPLMQFSVASNGLITSYQTAAKAGSLLQQQHASDDHAARATVWAIFSADA